MNIFKPKTLLHAYLLMVLPLITVSLSITFVWLQNQNLHKSHEILEKKLDQVCALQKMTLPTLLWNVNEEQIIATAEALMEDSEISGVAVFDDHKSVVSATGLFANKSYDQIAELSHYNHNETYNTHNFMRHFFHAISDIKQPADYFMKQVTMNFPTDYGLEPVGELFLLLSTKQMERSYRESLLWGLLIFLFNLCLLSVCVYIAYKYTIEKPLNRLRESINTANEEFFVSLEPDVVNEPKNEIEVVADSFKKLWAKEKRNDIEREELISNLKDKRAEQERFVYTLSHDLKSPLVTISAFLGMFEEDIKKGDLKSLEANIGVAKKAALRMQQLIKELLDLSRFGVKELQLEQVNLNTLINQSVDSLMSQDNSQKVIIDVDKNLPDVIVDVSSFLQVFENLLGNAIKYANPENSVTRIKISAECEEEKLTCCIHDNGIGMERSFLDKAFNLFDVYDPQKGGSGIGLSIVKRIIEQHGGVIWAESEGIGHGSSFYFTIPKSSCS